MKNPVTPLNNRLLTKIGSYLETKEGCEVVDIDYTARGCQATIQDSFGFRFEIEVKTIGRAQNDPEDIEKYSGNVFFGVMPKVYSKSSDK